MLQPSCMQDSVKQPWIFWRCSTTMANSGWHIFLPWKWFLFIYLLGGFKSLRSRVSFRQVHAKAGKQQTVPAWLSQRDKIFKIVFPLLLRPEPVVSSEVPVRQMSRIQMNLFKWAHRESRMLKDTRRKEEFPVENVIEWRDVHLDNLLPKLSNQLVVSASLFFHAMRHSVFTAYIN